MPRFLFCDVLVVQPNTCQMWEEDLYFPGCSDESASIIESPEPIHVHEYPPTPPHTESSHSSEPEATLSPLTYALPLHRDNAFSYSFDDVTRVKHAALEDTVRPIRPTPSTPNVSSTPMIFRSVAKPPVNPHDHSLLRTIHDEMHAARFINIEPLSLLANLLPLHFRGGSLHYVYMCAILTNTIRCSSTTSNSRQLSPSAVIVWHGSDTFRRSTLR